MEECHGGELSSETTGYGQLDLKSLVMNKKKGGKRTNPQEKPEQKKQIGSKLYKCPVSFLSQNEISLISI